MTQQFTEEAAKADPVASQYGKHAYSALVCQAHSPLVPIGPPTDLAGDDDKAFTWLRLVGLNPNMC